MLWRQEVDKRIGRKISDDEADWVFSTLEARCVG